MLQTLDPTYHLTLRIKDPYPQPQVHTTGVALTMNGVVSNWEPTRKYFNDKNGKTGCDEVLTAVKKALLDAGIVADVFFDRFEHS